MAFRTAAIALFLFAAGALAQRAPLPEFHADTSLVPIEVQVIDKLTYQPIRGLTRSDFIVVDENEPKEIVAFDARRRPRDIAVLLDMSGGPVNEGVNFSAFALLEIQREQDRLALLTFSDGKAKLWTPLTNSNLELRAGVDRIFSPKGGATGRRKRTSRLLDAIQTAADTLANTPPEHERLILIVTHNREMGSAVQKQNLLDQLLTRSLRVEAVVIPQEKATLGFNFGTVVGNPSLGLPNKGPAARPSPAPEYLDNLHSVDSLTEKTGGQIVPLNFRNAHRASSPQATGRTWDVDTVADIINAEVLARIQEQYGLAIRGAMAEKTQFHRLEIRLTDEVKQRVPNAEVHARVGYYSGVAAR